VKDNFLLLGLTSHVYPWILLSPNAKFKNMRQIMISMDQL
jgi:hypothetical protein